MKLFCAYAFTGEDLDILTQRMGMVVETLRSNGHDAYCNRFDPEVNTLLQQGDMKSAFKETFKNIDGSEALVAVVTSPRRSIGQLMEIGIAISQGKPIYLFEHTSAAESTYLPRLADKLFTWESSDDLKQALLQI